ncbi:MAG: S8 family serine peptidase [Prevotella sp.]|nr:S8 family serine peptidase [Prevotella sp.]MCM1075281.1 S8 family serine peptidase [Ruminococcus sp.]
MKKKYHSPTFMLVCSMMLSANTAMLADTPHSEPLRIPRVSRERTRPPRQMMLFNDLSRQSLSADEAHRGVARKNEVIPFTGKGVVIGVTDCGIDPRHPAFSNPLTGDSRVGLYITTESMAESGTGELRYNTFRPMEGDAVDPLYIVISAEGHGTHTAGTAAGSMCGNPYYGIAPEATLVMTDMGELIYEDEIELGITSTLDYARAHNMPCVASLSLGACAGMHDGSGHMTELLADELSDSGQIVCFAAGNDGRNFVSISHDFSSDPSPFRTAFSTDNWGGVPETIEAFLVSTDLNLRIAFTLVDPNSSLRKELWVSPYFTLADFSAEGENVLPLMSELQDYLDKDKSYLSLTRVQGADDNLAFLISGVTSWIDENHPYTIGITVDSPGGSVVRGYANYGSLFMNFGIEGYSRGTPEQSISDYCTSPYVIAVGGMNEREYYIDMNGERHDANIESYGPVHASGLYSSYGDIPSILPHVMASGTDVISSIPEQCKLPRVCAMTDSQGRQWYYGANSGTSMATPAVAGVIALWLQANPKLTRDDILEVMSVCSNTDYGTDRSLFGVPSAYDGLKYIIEQTASARFPFIGSGNPTVDKLMVRYQNDRKVECVVPVPIQGGTYQIISASGGLISTGRFEGVSFMIDLPDTPGIYIITAITPEGNFSQKLRK